MSAETSDLDPFEVLAESFLARYRSGERPSIDELAARHPELAGPIRELLPALLRLERDMSHDVAARPLPRLPEIDKRLGDYRLLREIGRGGMGVVYEAEQISLGRRVALKVLPDNVSGDREALARFRHEAKAAARLHHTNIVPVYEVGRDGEIAYYAMQFIEGQGLDKVIDELVRLRDPGRKTEVVEGPGPSAVGGASVHQPEIGPVARSLLTGQFAILGETPSSGIQPSAEFAPNAIERFTQDAILTSTFDLSDHEPTRRKPPTPPCPTDFLTGGSQASTSLLSGRLVTFYRSVADIGRQAAQGLAYAHVNGIVHRDIKPSNLLLDQAGVVWIADFGLAKGEDDGLTRTGDILGTFRYMPPCRFQGQGDHRADIYALGMTLYEMLTLRPAFNESDRLKLIERIKNEEPPRPRTLDSRIPRDLETIVLKAIEKDRERRYPSAEAMAEDLRRFLADEPIRARQVSAPERYWRWARRNPAIAMLGGVLMVLLVATTIGSIVAASYFRDLAGAAVLAQRDATIERDRAQRNENAERRGRYRSDIAAASGSLQLQNSGAARFALEDAPEEHRNWEWQYLHSQLDGASFVLPVPGGKIRSLVLSPSGRQFAVCCFEHNEVYLYDVADGSLDAVLRGHSATATSVAYRPDGEQVATIGNDQTIRLWEPATGRQTAVLKAEAAPTHPDRYSLVAYNSDGSRIASSPGLESSLLDPYSVAGAGTSRLWDAATGMQIAILAEWQDGTRPVAFSPDGKRLAVGFREYVHLCDAVTGRRLATLGPHSKPVEYIAYSPDGKRIASSAADSNAIHLWDGESGKEVAVLRGHTADIRSVQFSPDGARLVSGSIFPDDTARLWDAATGQLLAVLAGHQNRIQAVLFRPDSKRLVTASMDKTARLWDGRTGQFLAVLGGHTDQVFHVRFSANGTRMVTVSNDATLRLWNAQTDEFIGLLRGHADGFNSTPVFTPDGSRLVSGSVDGTVRIWDVSLAERNSILRGHESFVYDVAFSPDGEQVASAAWDGTARLWDASTGRQTGLLKHETGVVLSVAYRRDGSQMATVERDRGVTLWDVASRKAVSEWSTPAGETLTDQRASLSPDGTLLAAASDEGPVKLWNVATGREIARLNGHEKTSLDVDFHPEGGLLAASGRDGTIRLWDVTTLASVAVLRGHTASVLRVDFSTDGKMLASGSDDKTIRLWDALTHEQLAVLPVGTVVFSVAFSPDGTRLAAGCRDNTIRLFDVASRLQVAELRGHTDYVHSVAWSPDGTRIVSGSGDFTVRLWDALTPAARAQRADALRSPR